MSACFSHFNTLSTPIGRLKIGTDGEAITYLEVIESPPMEAESDDPLALMARDALQNYFESGTWPTGLPLAPAGTRFQERVWKRLCDIPCGETRTYGQLAEELETGPRAIGGACRANPVMLLVPCHRVVAANGDGGFGGRQNGPWMDIKRWLLAHETARNPLA